MPIFLSMVQALTKAKYCMVSKHFARLLLLSFALATVSPAAYAEPIDIASGVLDDDRILGPRWTRVDFNPLINGDHNIRIASDSSATIRFSVFRIVDAPSPNNRVRIGTSNSSATLAEWTGALDSSEQYYLGVWAASGSGNYIATIEAQAVGILAQPADLAVTESVDASFSVAAVGSGSLSYQWYVNDLAVVDATADTYSVISPSITDNGNVYRVDITDSNGTLSSDNAVLTVSAIVALEIISQPVGLTINEDEEASFTVTAAGSGTLAYQWYENDVAIVGATASNYSLISTTSDDGNVYRVDITDDIGTLSSDAVALDVLEIYVPVTVATIGQGSLDSSRSTAPRWVRFNFDSLAAATHTITLNWDSDADVRFKVFTAEGTQISSIIQGTSSSTWLGDLEANTQYYVAIWSASGIANFDATIEATIPISITSQPFDRVVTEGDDVTFYVQASGSGTLSYQWFADGAPLMGETSDSLTVFATSLVENGSLYHVEIYNGYETAASELATLTVNEPLVLGLFSQEADTSAWMLDGPAPTFNFNTPENTDAWGKTLLRVGDLLLVGGDFQGIKPARNAAATIQPFLAALDAVSGQPVSTFQVPIEINAVVRALALSPNGEQLYVGGDFGLVVLNAATGALDFTVSVTKGGNPGRVFDIAVGDTQLYIGGDFTGVSNSYRANLARLSLSGQLDAVWNPSVTYGYNNGRAAPVQSIAVSPTGDIVYVGGNFQFINGVPVMTTPANQRVSMLSLSALDGSVLPERFTAFVGTNNKGLSALDIVVTEFYVIIAWGGPNYVSFHSLDGTQLVQYRAKGDVQALQIVGDHVFVGHHGEFFGTLEDANPQEAIVSLDPEIVLPFKIHSFRIDDPSFLPEQAWQITGAFGVWGIAAAEDSLWVAGQIWRAGSNDRSVDGLVRFVAQ